MPKAIRTALHLFLLVHLSMMTISLLSKTPVHKEIKFLTARYQWTFGLHQNWSMFTPNPRLSTSWMDVVGIRADGSRVSIPLPHGTPEPDGIEWAYDRSGKLERNAIGKHRKKLRAAFVRWVCRTHEDHDPLRKIEIASMTQTTPTPAERAAKPRETWPIRRKVMETWNCRRR